MPKVVGVRFRGIGKSYHFSPGDFVLHPGDVVLVNTSQGDSLGIVSERIYEIDESQLKSELKPVLRIATAEDEAIYEENGQREKEAYKICRQKIREHELEMNLVDVECVFDRSRMIFYFTSEGRVDFRNLVRDLAQIFRIRIELRQIGVRDEARMVGGLGICGRPLCCASFLNDFIPVSIKMAKEQGLSMNPGKLSGCCGRLMCCLKYEQEAYESIRKQMPKIGALLQLEKGKYKVESIDYLREKIACIAVDNPEESCILGVEEYQAIRRLTNPRSKSNVEDVATIETEETLSPAEKAVLAEIEAENGKTKIVFSENEANTKGIKLPQQATDVLAENTGCCCQQQEGQAGSCQGGCCGNKHQSDASVATGTIHEQNLSELADKKQLPSYPSWIDGEIIVAETTSGEETQPQKRNEHRKQSHGRRQTAYENNGDTTQRKHRSSHFAEKGRRENRPFNHANAQQMGQRKSKPQATKVQSRGEKSAKNESKRFREPQRKNGLKENKSE